MKRVRVVTTLATCILCLGLLVFGVLSAVQVGFTFRGTLSFNPEGVYVDIEGQVYRGTDYNNLQPLTESEYSYEGKNYTNAEGSPSGNFTMAEWNPAIIFLPTEKYLQYEIKITNKSRDPITALPSSFDAISGVDALELSSDVLRIDPGETGTYELNLEYTGDQAITNEKFDVTFDIRTTSAFVEAQTGVTFTQESGTITAVSGDNSTNSIESMRDTLFIPKTVNGTTITGYGIIDESPELTAITLSSNIKKVIFQADITSIGSDAFNGCSSLTSITIPNTVTSIGTFNGCSSLTSIKIPSGVTSIKSNAFTHCSSLTSVTFGENSQLKSIGTFAFQGCNSLTTVTFGDNSQLETIGDYAFYSCISLTSIEIPSRVIRIGSEAFYYCSSLISVTFGDNSQLESIGSDAFHGCSSLTSITFGDNSQLETIEGSAFWDCSSLTSITIPSGVTSIESNAFFACSSLTLIDMTSISDWSTLTLGSISFETMASTTAPTVIKVASEQIDTAKNKLTSSVVGGSTMKDKIQLKGGTTTYTWNGTTWVS